MGQSVLARSAFGRANLIPETSFHMHETKDADVGTTCLFLAFSCSQAFVSLHESDHAFGAFRRTRYGAEEDADE